MSELDSSDSGGEPDVGSIEVSHVTFVEVNIRFHNDILHTESVYNTFICFHIKGMSHTLFW